jgi:hypothetical protein
MVSSLLSLVGDISFTATRFLASFFQRNRCHLLYPGKAAVTRDATLSGRLRLST